MGSASVYLPLRDKHVGQMCRAFPGRAVVCRNGMPIDFVGLAKQGLGLVEPLMRSQYQREGDQRMGDGRVVRRKVSSKGRNEPRGTIALIRLGSPRSYTTLASRRRACGSAAGLRRGVAGRLKSLAINDSASAYRRCEWSAVARLSTLGLGPLA